MDATDLQQKYEELGFQHGYAFAMTPLAYLANADTVLVGLNPGLDGHTHDDVSWENIDGNAYFTGRWQDGEGAEPTPIQSQVRGLHALLGLGPEAVFAAQFIPFRSASFVSLPERGKAIAFACDLWRWLLPQTRARRFICMGMEAAWQIAQIIQPGMEPAKLPSGWGRTCIRRYVTDEGRVVVGLPHPSRYRLIGTGDAATRAEREAAILRATALAGPAA